MTRTKRPEERDERNPKTVSEPGKSPIPRRLRRIAGWIVLAVVFFSAGRYQARRAKPAAPDAGESAREEARADFYTCGMHPWIILPKPGLCPICGMELVPLDPAKFTGEIAIDPVIVQNIGVRIRPVRTGPLESVIRTVGTIDYDETRLADVNNKVVGWIEKLHVDYLGAPVRRGEPLFDLYSPELYAAQEEYLLEWKRQRGRGTGSGTEPGTGTGGLLESARTRLLYYDLTAEQIRELEERGRPEKAVTLGSPYEGIVIEKHATEGMRIDPGMRVFRIADLSKVWVMATLYEYQLPFVEVGQRAVMSLPYIPGQTFEGKVIYIYPFLDPKTREVKVRLEFDNPGLFLKPGMFANVELRGVLAEKRTLAPVEAVIDTGRRKVAFVSLGGGKFEPRDVRTGVEADGTVEILEGLRPGEMVVTSGQFLLDSEARMRESLARMMRGTQAADQEPAVPETAPTEAAAELPRDVAGVLETILDAYLGIGAQLADDSVATVPEQARRLVDGIDRLLDAEIPGGPGFRGRRDGIARARARASKLQSAEDLKTARSEFADLSLELSSLLRAVGVPDSYGRRIEELHCPMFRSGQGGSVWLQAAGAVRNPFFGKMMPECFDERRVLPVARTAKSAAPDSGTDSQ